MRTGGVNAARDGARRAGSIRSRSMGRDSPELATDLAGIPLRSPVLLAAGTAGHLDELAGVVDLSRVGGIVTKSITPEPREGNATWRITECKAGMLNAIGLANMGLDAFEAHVLPRVAGVPAPVIGSVAGFSIDDYVRVAASMDQCDALAGVELNVSCPNVHAGTDFGADPAALRELVGQVRRVVARKRLLVKLPPAAIGTPHGIASIARAATEGGGAPRGPCGRPGADALCISNTIPAMAIDVRTRRPRLANVTGGLSGPALHPVALRLVYEAHRSVCRDAGVPIVGVGGVMRWEDAAEFILAGASCVQVGTLLFADPGAVGAITRGLARWVRSQGASSVRELVGAIRV